MKDFTDKVVVITGAGSGIGRALALGFAHKGAKLALVDIDVALLSAIGADCSQITEHVSSHRVDVSDRHSVAQLPDEVIARHGAVDILINNAGVNVGAYFEDHPIEDAEWLLGVNLFGVIYGCKSFLPYLKARPAAHIVNLSSMFGIMPLPGQALYSASKFAVRGFTEALWGELADSNVDVTVVHPGTIRSNLIRHTRMPDESARQPSVAAQEKYGMDTDKAAAKIIRAVQKRQKRVRVGMDAYVADWLKRLSPVLFQQLIGRLLRAAS